MYSLLYKNLVSSTITSMKIYNEMEKKDEEEHIRSTDYQLSTYQLIAMYKTYLGFHSKYIKDLFDPIRKI